MLNVLMWLFLGIIAGFIVSSVKAGGSGNRVGTVLAGVVGAFVGGVVYSAVSLGYLAAQIDQVSLIAALIGSALVMAFIFYLLGAETQKEI